MNTLSYLPVKVRLRLATVHREPNQVKWVGVRPGHNGEQVLIKVDFGVNTLLYTVPADKILLIFSWQIGIGTAAAGNARLQLETAVPAVYYELGNCVNAAGSTSANSQQALWVPIEVPETYRIYLTTNIACVGGIQGILIDA